MREITCGYSLKIHPNQFSELIFNAPIKQVELATSQFIIEQLWTSRLKKCFLKTINSDNGLCLPMPLSLLKKIENKGHKVNFRKSRFLWCYYLSFLMCRSFFSLLANCYSILCEKKIKITKKKYVYFENLSINNVPFAKNKTKKFTICHWYAQWKGKIESLSIIAHGVKVPSSQICGIKVQYLNPAWTNLNSAAEKMSFFLWLSLAFSVAFISLFFGSWWNTVMLGEAAKAKALSLVYKSKLAKEYLFPWSGGYYRPLWTYKAQEKGSKITLYFFGTCASPKVKSKQNKQYEWGPSSWPNILVWTSQMKNMLKSDYNCKDTTKVVGPIWFEDSVESLPKITPPAIAVFNLESHRVSAHQAESSYADWCNLFPNMERNFINDIQEVLESENIAMVWKTKREIGKLRTTKNKKLFANLKTKKNVVEISPGIAPQKVVEKCCAVISAPFTGAAIIGHQAKIPSVFYDPTSFLDQEDQAANGIVIIQGKQSLAKWVKQIKQNSKAKK